MRDSIVRDIDRQMERKREMDTAVEPEIEGDRNKGHYLYCLLILILSMSVSL